MFDSNTYVRDKLKKERYDIRATGRLKEYIIKDFGKPMYMNDWIAKLDDFLRISEHEILMYSGRLSHEDAALRKAAREYEKYRKKVKNEPSKVEKDFFKILEAVIDETQK